MLDFSRGSIQVFFARSLQEAMALPQVPRSALIVTPDHNPGWNDFTYNFFANLNLVVDSQEDSFRIPMRLMFKDDSNTTRHLETIFNQRGPVFRLKELLGKAFSRYVRGLWSTLPKTVRDSYKGSTELKSADTRVKVESLLKDNQNTYGLNSWPAGFYRGVLADPTVINYVTEKATEALS